VEEMTSSQAEYEPLTMSFMVHLRLTREQAEALIELVYREVSSSGWIVRNPEIGPLPTVGYSI
jgi:hypothetical protein